MGNSVKYNSSAVEPFSLKKGNFYIGTGDVQKGPSNFWSTITPPTGGYTIYLDKPSNGPSIYTPNNDSELIFITNQIAGTSYTTVNECLTYFAGQNDKMIFDQNCDEILTDGLVFYLDAGFTSSYPRSGITWYDLSGDNNGTLTNGPSYNSDNGGGIVFDGTDDYVSLSNYTLNNNFTYGIWVMRNGNGDQGTRGIVISNAATYIDVGFNGGIMFSLILSNGSQNLTTYGSMVPIGQWAYYTATYNQENAILYLNGVQIASNNYSLGVGRIGSTFRIGSFDGGSYHLNGKIAIAQVYNKALTAAEVIRNYDAQKTRFGLM